jgi:hypothetical protein
MSCACIRANVAHLVCYPEECRQTGDGFAWLLRCRGKHIGAAPSRCTRGGSGVVPESVAITWGLGMKATYSTTAVLCFGAFAMSCGANRTDPGSHSGVDASTAFDLVDADGNGPPGDAPHATTFDPNGVKQIYPTKLGRALPWTLGFDDWDDRALGFGSMSGTGKDIVITKGGQVRMTVKAEDSDCEGDTNQGDALQRGYMCSENDWYAFEITAYFKLIEPAGDSDDQDWVLYGGGGRHTGGGPPTGCLGSAYKASYHYADARVRVRKENYHVNYFNRDWKQVAGGIDYTQNDDRWLGMKMVRYEIMRDGARGMRMEQYLDLGGIDADGNPVNDWQLVNVEEDHPSAGSWGSGATGCDAPATDQVMLWGGPWITFRWDGTTSSTRLMSVREIEAPADPPGSPDRG